MSLNGPVSDEETRALLDRVIGLIRSSAVRGPARLNMLVAQLDHPYGEWRKDSSDRAAFMAVEIVVETWERNFRS